MDYKPKYNAVTTTEYNNFTHAAKYLQVAGGTLFSGQIWQMNNMYKLPANRKPTIYPGELASVRITKFIKTLNAEIIEGVEIQEKLELYEALLEEQKDLDQTYHIELHNMKVELLTDLSDWLGDVIVYCKSEALKFGLPLDEVQSIIMASNYSKLNSDGSATYNEDGKVLKSVNFAPPEAYIKHTILKAM